MDGDLKPLNLANSSMADTVARSREFVRVAPSRAKTARWLIIVGTLLGLLLAGLYGFNRYREQAIANFFASNKPPPAQIAAVTATSESVPRFATGIGSLAAVHQVTITPEIGGRVTAILFTPGATVNAGDPLVQLNDAPERGDLANYEAQARMAAVTLARNTQLAARQVASRETVDQNQSQLDQARAQVLKTQAIIAQKLVRAPFKGRLGVRQVEVGQYLNPGAAIVTLSDLKHLYVNFTLPSTMRPQIALEQKVNVTADAFPGRRFEATITTIEPQIRADTRTIAVQATLQNPDEALLPGMYINAAVVLPAEPDRVVLPETAVDYTLYGDSVYVVREDGKTADGKPILKATRTPVKTGPRWDGKVAILEGLKPGDQVVAAGQIKLQSGAQVIVTGNPPPQPPANPTPN
ncbi:MAG: efflux RND transporter periplasmic adaptor subunit [Alphaproteobacteria bacterium]|nr:MAG: efflux RND transporter periplasmic adaptor subunit [Alphaproteobacteria bacterium]